jgi:hypothetical protein
MNNPYQIAAENFAMRFYDYRPYPFVSYVYFVGPATTALAMPAAHEARKWGEDAWKPLL